MGNEFTLIIETERGAKRKSNSRIEGVGNGFSLIVYRDRENGEERKKSEREIGVGN